MCYFLYGNNTMNYSSMNRALILNYKFHYIRMYILTFIFWRCDIWSAAAVEGCSGWWAFAGELRRFSEFGPFGGCTGMQWTMVMVARRTIALTGAFARNTGTRQANKAIWLEMLEHTERSWLDDRELATRQTIQRYTFALFSLLSEEPWTKFGWLFSLQSSVLSILRFVAQKSSNGPESIMDHFGESFWFFQVIFFFPQKITPCEQIH